jgi:hypothetical protein
MKVTDPIIMTGTMRMRIPPATILDRSDRFLIVLIPGIFTDPLRNAKHYTPSASGITEIIA